MKKLIENTYDHKEIIRSNGGVWNPQEKSWYVPTEKHEELQEKIYPNFRKIQAEAKIPKKCGQKTGCLEGQYTAMEFAIAEIVAEETKRDFFVVVAESRKMSFNELEKWISSFDLPILSELQSVIKILDSYVSDHYRDFQASRWENDVGDYENRGDVFDRVIKKFDHFCDKEILKQTQRAAYKRKIAKMENQ